MLKQYFMILLLVSFVVAAIKPGMCDESIESLKDQMKALEMRVERLEMRQRQSGKPDDFFPQGRRGKYEPFYELERLHRDRNHIYDDTPSSSDMNQHRENNKTTKKDYSFDFQKIEQGYQITLNTKGMGQDDLNIEIKEHSITVKNKAGDVAKDYKSQQDSDPVSVDSFMQTIPLPIDADTTNVKTEQKGGNIVFTIPQKK